MKRRLLIGASIVSLVAGSLVALTRMNYASVALPVASQQFFALNLSDSTSKPLNFGQFRGKVVVINFWAPWCPPCVEEMPEFDRLAAEFRGKNVEFVGIAIDSPSNVREFGQKLQVSYPLIPASFEGADLARAFGNASGALPFTVLLDRQGRAVQQKMGRMQSTQLREWLVNLSGSN
jgi:thiol-disulfide isomerase/thioredoxin